jgi:hypothetical protein
MKLTVPLFAFLLLTFRASGEEISNASPADPNIRPAGDVTLKFERKIEIPEIKRFDGGVLEIFPGDTVHLEFEEEGGKLVRPKVVAEVKDPKRTISFAMTQDPSMTMLTRKTAIQQTVAMDCENRGLGSEEFSPTNLNPTEKGLSAFDSWPSSVWVLRLSNIEVTSKPAAEVYEEKVSKNSEREKPKRK